MKISEEYMKLKKEDILNTISEMSLIELMELVSMIENKFNIKANANIYNNKKDDKKEDQEKTEYLVKIKDIGKNKISLIKVVRNILNLGLKQAKEMIESIPVTLKEGISKEEAEDLKKKIEETGASVEIL